MKLDYERSIDGKPKFIELFCGIGGFAESVRQLAEVQNAIDISQNALEVYRLNFSRPAICRTIESLGIEETSSWKDRSWWMSPPCQPHTRRGKHSDVCDPRSAAFLNVLRLIDAHRPPEIGIENVPLFERSAAYTALKKVLDKNGYSHQQIVLCPTQLGFRNRRSRFYLIAGLNGLVPWRELTQDVGDEFLVAEQPDLSQLELMTTLEQAYQSALDVIDKGDSKFSACFTSAYGRSIVRSGSYLRTATGVRRFSPREIIDQLGFCRQFRLPNWPYKKLWPLVGNSLSIPAVRYVVRHLPSLNNAIDCSIH